MNRPSFKIGVIILVNPSSNPFSTNSTRHSEQDFLLAVERTTCYMRTVMTDVLSVVSDSNSGHGHESEPNTCHGSTRGDHPGNRPVFTFQALASSQTQDVDTSFIAILINLNFIF